MTAEDDKPDVGPLEELGLNAFYGHYGQVTDQDRVPTATSPRSVDLADVRAHDFHASQDVRAVLAPGRAASLTTVVRF